MKAYVYKAELLCEACAEREMEGLWYVDPSYVDDPDSNVWPQGPFDNGGGEADSPQHCGRCQIFLHNSLTKDGEGYVLDMIKWFDEGRKLNQTRGNPEIIEQWRDAYSYLFS